MTYVQLKKWTRAFTYPGKQKLALKGRSYDS